MPTAYLNRRGNAIGICGGLGRTPRETGGGELKKTAGRGAGAQRIVRVDMDVGYRCVVPRYNAPVASSYRAADPRRERSEPDWRSRFGTPQGDPAGAAECAPPLDVLETAAGVELILDLPGVALTEIRIVLSQGMLIVTGRKLPGGCADRHAAFHLAERSFGRFARAVRLAGAVDAGRAQATLIAGELRITLPRIDERRGRDRHIAVTSG